MFAKFHTAKWADMSEVAAHRMHPLLNIKRWQEFLKYFILHSPIPWHSLVQSSELSQMMKICNAIYHTQVGQRKRTDLHPPICLAATSHPVCHLPFPVIPTVNRQSLSPLCYCIQEGRCWECWQTVPCTIGTVREQAANYPYILYKSSKSTLTSTVNTPGNANIATTITTLISPSITVVAKIITLVVTILIVIVASTFRVAITISWKK